MYATYFISKSIHHDSSHRGCVLVLFHVWLFCDEILRKKWLESKWALLNFGLVWPCNKIKRSRAEMKKKYANLLALVTDYIFSFKSGYEDRLVSAKRDVAQVS